MNKISEIFNSWITAASPDENQRKVAEYRISVCDGCSSKAHNDTLNFFYCSECGCPLSKKVFSPKPGPEACPLAKWEK